jgi:hypothetical protein
MSKGKGGFRNMKLGKNVYRQLKRRGPPQPVTGKREKPDHIDKNRHKPPASPVDEKSLMGQRTSPAF